MTVALRVRTNWPTLGDMATSTNAAKTSTPSERGIFGRLVHRLTAETHVLDAEDLQDTATRSGCCTCRDLIAGEDVRVAGRIRSIQYTPSEQSPTLSAELFDGSGSLQLVWLGQRRIPGIEPGRELVVRGRIAQQHGESTLYNPWYELIPTSA